jgi:acetyl esterase/lipase
LPAIAAPHRTWMHSVARRLTAALGLTVFVLTGMSVPSVPADGIAIRGIVYKSTPTVDIKLDVYMPKGKGPFPAVVLVHGGSWKTNWRGEFETAARKFLARKVASYVIDFRMPCNPDNPGEGVDPNLCHYPYPTPLEDIGDAVRWVRQNGSLYKSITDKVGIMGSSTGGNLAMELGVIGVAGDSRPDAVVAWSGLGDLTTPAESPHNRENYVGCAYAVCPELWEAASPSRNVDPEEAPLYLSGSEFERAPTKEEQQLTINRWEAAGVPNQWHLVAGSACHSRTCWKVDPEILNESAAWIWHWIAGRPL